MWLLVIPALAIAAGFGWGVSKVLNKEPPLDAKPPGTPQPGASLPNAGAGLGLPGSNASANAAAALAAAKVQAEQAAAAALAAAGLAPGLGFPIPGNPNTKVDGHGTGLQVEDPSLIRPPAIPGGQPTSSTGDFAAAAAAANKMQDEIIIALNTPEGDRTPEQLALLIGVASLPTL